MSAAATQERTALVLYGSETGNAQDVAEELGRLAQRLHFSSFVSSLDAVEPTWLQNYSVVLIAISTTGQGDFPANSKLFWKKLLRKKLPGNYLARVSFALFGLGDSSYPKFNWAALKLYKRLLQLGADPVANKGEGDEQHPEGVDSLFIPWTKTLREQLLSLFPLASGLSPIPENILLQPQWLLGKADQFNSSRQDAAPVVDSSYQNAATDTALDVTLESNDRVTAEGHWQDVRLLKFKASEATDYEPGDILTVYPENAPEDIDNLLKLLGWQDIADVPITFRHNSDFVGPTTAPEPKYGAGSNTGTMTLKHMVTHHLDLNAIPRRSFFSLIMHFTSDKFQKTRLQELTDTDYTDELFDYTTRPHRSILEVLQEFDTLKIPWQWAASILPPLRGRQFSIASGGQLKSDASGLACFELLVAIVKYKTVIRKIRRGTCTRYLDGLAVGSKLKVTLVKGSLGINSRDASRPIIMIGPGTGVAPMRSLIWQRLRWQARLSEQVNSTNGVNGNAKNELGENLLFFGCRNKESDYFFQDEWQDLQQRMPLEVIPAFSRDQSRKVYVQDVIRDHLQEVFRLVNDLQGIVYVCGSSGKMPQAVREALTDTFQQGLSSDRKTAEAYLNAMEKQGRYKQETW